MDYAVEVVLVEYAVPVVVHQLKHKLVEEDPPALEKLIKK